MGICQALFLPAYPTPFSSSFVDCRRDVSPVTDEAVMPETEPLLARWRSPTSASQARVGFFVPDLSSVKERYLQNRETVGACGASFVQAPTSRR
jgi:hypothetical protein